jgi:type III secretion system YscQ/HrcQ family protein
VKRVEDDAVEPTFVANTLAAPPRRDGTRAWRKFLFPELEKVSRAQARLVGKLESLLSSRALTGTVSEALSNCLGALFELPTEVRVEGAYVIRPAELRRYVVDPTFLATIATLPHKPRGLIEVELSLAHAVVEILLRGAGNGVPLRPLTEVEEGIMAFVVLEALRAFAPSLSPGLPRLHLEGTAHHVDLSLFQLRNESQIVFLPLRCAVGVHDGFVRIFLPASFLELALSGAGAEEKKAHARARIAQHRARLASIQTWLRAEIGRAEIAAADVAGLGVGDVVLIEELTVRCDRGDVGTAELRVGMGRAGIIHADVALDGDKYMATITSFNTHPNVRAEPEEVSMEGPSREGAELLSDIPLQIAVELARVPVTADQVVALHLGQVVELNRGPGEPVQLSVNGKLIARGELVEVEGQLGVRILSIG